MELIFACSVEKSGDGKVLNVKVRGASKLIELLETLLGTGISLLREMESLKR